MVRKWQLLYTKDAQKDARKLAAAGLKNRTLKLLQVLEENPFKNPPRYEKLVGDLTGAYSRRITIQHRLIYKVIEKEKIVVVLRMWSHYE